MMDEVGNCPWNPVFWPEELAVSQTFTVNCDCLCFHLFNKKNIWTLMIPSSLPHDCFSDVFSSETDSLNLLNHKQYKQIRFRFSSINVKNTFFILCLCIELIFIVRLCYLADSLERVVLRPCTNRHVWKIWFGQFSIQPVPAGTRN